MNAQLRWLSLSLLLVSGACDGTLSGNASNDASAYDTFGWRPDPARPWCLCHPKKPDRCRCDTAPADDGVDAPAGSPAADGGSVVPSPGGGDATAPPPAPPSGSVPWLHVSGSLLTSDSGQVVVLRGADVMRSEWDLDMSFERAAIPELANAWGGNVIKRGFAADPLVDSAFSWTTSWGVTVTHATYVGWLDEYVSLCEAHSMYVVFSFRSHAINGPQPNKPDAKAKQALAFLAARYKDKPNVLYSLMEEPHDVTWSELQPIFQEMVNAIQAAAAPQKPLIFVPGTNWGRELSGAISNPVVGDNVVYKTHPHNNKALFQSQFIDAFDAGLPVFIGNFGPVNFGGMYDQTMDDVTVLLDWTRGKQVGWIAWAFDEGGGPALIESNATFVPTNPYGTTVKTEMLKTPPLPASSAPPPSPSPTPAGPDSGVSEPAPAPTPPPPTSGTCNNAAPPPAGGYFSLLPAGSFASLPNDAAAAGMVKCTTWEPRPENATPNHTVPPAGFVTQGYSGMQNHAALFGRVTGNFTGTTDEIIQWAAAKWGLPDELIRAEAVAESTWYQARRDASGNPVKYYGYGDYGHCGGSPPPSGYGSSGPSSFGLMQIKWCAHMDSSDPAYGTWPWSEQSTAYNVDYFGAVIRGCIEGWDGWLGNGYKAGDLWGCVGRWFAGEWYSSGAVSYIDTVKQHMNGKPWLDPGF